MPKKRQKKNRSALIVLALIICISIGYAALTTNLKINGKANVKATAWNVHFDNIVVTDGSVDSNFVGLKEATIDPNDNTKVDYIVSLLKPGEFYEFTVDVVNEGTLDAMLDTYVVTNLTESQQKYLDYTVEYLDGGLIANEGTHDLLEKGEKETIKVGIYYNTEVNEDELPTSVETISATVEMNYVQADETATKRVNTIKKVVTNRDIGKYVEFNTNLLEKREIAPGKEMKSDWRVLYVDNNNGYTYFISADYFPTSKYPESDSYTIVNEYGVKGNTEAFDDITATHNFTNYLKDNDVWSSIVDVSSYDGIVHGTPNYTCWMKAFDILGAGDSSYKYNGDIYLKDLFYPPEKDGVGGYFFDNYYWEDNGTVWGISTTGGYSPKYITSVYGCRPVIIIPSNVAVNVYEEEYDFISNANIGDFIDVGNSYVGTDATNDDWQIIYVNVEKGFCYAMLADYLPANEMPVATNIQNDGEYKVWGAENSGRDNFLNYIESTTVWNTFSNGISDITVTGAVTEGMLSSSYNLKNGRSWNSDYTDPVLFKENSNINSYWIDKKSSSYGNNIDYYGYNTSGNTYYYDQRCGLRPVMKIPLNLEFKFNNNVIKVVK